MKKPGSRGQGRFHNNTVAVIAGLTLVLLLSAGLAFGSGGGEAGPKGWVNTDTFRVINFVVLAGALFFVLKKPVAQVLSGRIASIRLQLEELESKKIEAEKQLAIANEALAKLDKEAERIIAGYIQQGEEAKVRIIDQAKLAAEKLEAQAQRNIEHQFQQAKLKLQSEVIELALAKAETVITDSITDKDQERLVEEYLDKVVA